MDGLPKETGGGASKIAEEVPACLTEGKDTKHDNQREREYETGGAGLHLQKEDANVVGTYG